MRRALPLIIAIVILNCGWSTAATSSDLQPVLLATLPTGQQPYAVAVNPTTARLYVARQAGEIQVFDTVARALSTPSTWETAA